MAERNLFSHGPLLKGVKGLEEVRSYMQEHGINGEIIMFKEEQAKTSASAANHLGCEVAQIAKSIVLMAETPILVILSGDMRVDLKKLAEVIGEKAKLASPEYVSEKVGFIIGGVPPMGFDRPVRILIDKSIERFSEVFSSGGSRDSILKIGVDELKGAVEYEMVEVSK
ncbi:MAG: YbaK/EbsC family protein [Candidatus Thermoplasmatota archaeon]|jgi:Cys-tRNA(Pro) deacylase|nr:YbaK/EbsC family protein [Candidatus Thermoplasmatota archaeon]